MLSVILLVLLYLQQAQPFIQNNSIYAYLVTTKTWIITEAAYSLNCILFGYVFTSKSENIHSNVFKVYIKIIMILSFPRTVVYKIMKNKKNLNILKTLCIVSLNKITLTFCVILWSTAAVIVLGIGDHCMRSIFVFRWWCFPCWGFTQQNGRCSIPGMS